MIRKISVLVNLGAPFKRVMNYSDIQFNTHYVTDNLTTDHLSWLGISNHLFGGRRSLFPVDLRLQTLGKLTPLGFLKTQTLFFCLIFAISLHYGVVNIWYILMARLALLKSEEVRKSQNLECICAQNRIGLNTYECF